MPQVWLTYEEIGAHYACTCAEARQDSIDAGWDRRVSRDGATRVKLPPATAIEYMRAVARTMDAEMDKATDEQIALLQSVLEKAGPKPIRVASSKAA